MDTVKYTTFHADGTRYIYNEAEIKMDLDLAKHHARFGENQYSVPLSLSKFLFYLVNWLLILNNYFLF